jgi:ribosomal protein S18 acetylase RimI-like enzyme
VPQQTLARIESDRPGDPRLGTVVALMRAAGGDVRIVDDTGRRDALVPPADDEPRDAAGRRYPAHLDLRKVLTPEDWWGAWWVHTAGPRFTRELWPREAPPYTFDLDRRRRDERRDVAERRRAAARAEVRRVDADDAAVCALVAFIDGVAVGWLVASLDPTSPSGPDSVTLHRVEVHPSWRRVGIGRALMEAFRAELYGAGGSVVHAAVHGAGGVALLLRAGFRRTRGETLLLVMGQEVRRTS